MFSNTGTMYDTDTDTSREADKAMYVLSCGHYRLVHLEKLDTRRPNGRKDWQILYLASGLGHFEIKGEERIIKPGSVVVYEPHTPQKYYYLREEKPDIYWVHFTGKDIPVMLQRLGMSESSCIQIGEQNNLPELFEEMIGELQQRQIWFDQICKLRLEELCLQIARKKELAQKPVGRRHTFIADAVSEMHRTYHQSRTIEEYAQKYNISVCWFIRRFKEATGESPRKYLIKIRIRKACELLENSSLNVGEIAALVGYENPLYFSRQFKEERGISPREYRDRINQKG